jgi:HSP20 family protein
MPAFWNDPGRLMQLDPFRLMQELVRDPFFGPGPMERWFGDHSPATFNPTVDVVDEGTAIRVSAELPGLEKDDIELSLQDGALTVSGEKRSESSTDEDGCYRTERAYGYFRRVIPLPTDVDLDNVDADFKKGVLTVHVPKLKTAASGTKRIPIS